MGRRLAPCPVLLVKNNRDWKHRQVADDIEADLILIGTVGRSGIKGTIVGNTSERLLDHTASDLLVLN